MTFADTSALIAVLDAADPRNPIAAAAWDGLLSDVEMLCTSNYVVVEAISVLQRRLGAPAVRGFVDGLLPALEAAWVTPLVHSTALAAFLVSARRDLSLVDCVSFELMRQMGIDAAFTFDPHFAEQGFRCVPEPATVTE